MSRKRESEELNRLRGNPGKRSTLRSSGLPALSRLPATPKHLGQVASAEYKRFGGELVKNRLLHGANLKALEFYACAYEAWTNAQADIAENGLVFQTRTGYRTANPACGIATAAQAEMRRWLILLMNEGVGQTKKSDPEGDTLLEFIRRGQKPHLIKK